MRPALALALLLLAVPPAAADPVTQVIRSAWDPLAGALREVPDDTGAAMSWATDQGAAWGMWAAGQAAHGTGNLVAQAEPLLPL